MTGRLTAARFSAFPESRTGECGGGYATARFLTGSAAAELALVNAIGELVTASGRGPDVEAWLESGAAGAASVAVPGRAVRPELPLGRESLQLGKSAVEYVLVAR